MCSILQAVVQQRATLSMYAVGSEQATVTSSEPAKIASNLSSATSRVPPVKASPVLELERETAGD